MTTIDRLHLAVVNTISIKIDLLVFLHYDLAIGTDFEVDLAILALVLLPRKAELGAIMKASSRGSWSPKITSCLIGEMKWIDVRVLYLQDLSIYFWGALP